MESDQDYHSDEKESCTGSEEAEIPGWFTSVSSVFDPNMTKERSLASSYSSINSSASESGEEDFHPELFGILDNPGVVRFGCVDYPEEVSEYSDDEDLAASEHSSAPDWIRLSYDTLNLDNNNTRDNLKNIPSYSKILSRSVENIHSESDATTARRTINCNYKCFLCCDFVLFKMK